MAIVNLTTESDADFMRGFLYQYKDSGQPVDLTGNVMKMGIRRQATDTTELLQLTTDNGGLIINSATVGYFTLWITLDQLLRLEPYTYVHSLIRIRPNDNLNLRVWSGTLTHNAGPSRGPPITATP
jgi:hypothetical protein